MGRDYYTEVEGEDGKMLQYPNLSHAAYVGGMIHGVLDASGFGATVTVQDNPYDERGYVVVFRIEFSAKVLQRDRRRTAK
jgi:hypothetical protein